MLRPRTVLPSHLVNGSCAPCGRGYRRQTGERSDRVNGSRRIGSLPSPNRSPVDPLTTDTFPAIPTTPSPRPPRRRGRALKRAVLVLLGLGILAVFGAIGYVRWTEGKIDRIPAEELVSLASPPSAAGAPVNFLIVGTDDRSAVPDDWDDTFGDLSGRRTDVIMLAHLVPGERIQLLSLPRDLKVDIAGHGTNRINAAFVFGGPDLLVRTVEEATGVPVHHYVEIDFAGVGAVVDSLGGVDVDFPYPARDTKSGFAADAGTQTLNGELAVAYARSRHYEILKDGSWQSHTAGDIARTQRQQEILVSLFDQVTSPSSAFDLPRFLPTFADQITADEGLTLGTIAGLGRAALGLRSSAIERMTLPVENTRGEDGRAYVEPTAAAEAVIAAFLSGEPYASG